MIVFTRYINDLKRRGRKLFLSRRSEFEAEFTRLTNRIKAWKRNTDLSQIRDATYYKHINDIYMKHGDTIPHKTKPLHIQIRARRVFVQMIRRYNDRVNAWERDPGHFIRKRY
jgi:hypothetical protein